MLIDRHQSLLLIVDIQEKLAPAIHEGAAAIANNQRLLAAADRLGVPIVVSEQYVRGLGPTVQDLQPLPPRAQRFEKMHFSCAREPGFLDLIADSGRRRIIVTGMEAHAGPTPMELRRDALLAASELVLEVNRIAVQRAPHARGTVGTMELFPNSRNVIPGRASLSVDLRAPDDAQLLDMDAALRAACARIATERSLQITVEQVVYFPPQPFTPQLVQAVRANADDLGYSSMDVVSGAGHDAVYLARVAPAAMIFVPCDDGISHNEIENAAAEHLEAGCNVLLRAMLAAAEVVA